MRCPTLLLLLLLAAASCGESTAPLEPCTGPVELTVAAQPPFTISWTPRCGARELSVTAPASQGVFITYWYLRSTDSRMAPGFRYGEVPVNTEVIVPSDGLLVSGRSMVFALRGNGGEIGRTVFTPP